MWFSLKRKRKKKKGYTYVIKCMCDLETRTVNSQLVKRSVPSLINHRTTVPKDGHKTHTLKIYMCYFLLLLNMYVICVHLSD